jgi:hypothetical protein
VYIIIFAGSVFYTSSKFFDTEVTSKYYYVVLLVLVTLVFASLLFKYFSLKKIICSKEFLLFIFIITVFQAMFGLCQFFKLMDNNNPVFPIVGSFDNPAGFSSVLSLVFPIGLYLLIFSKKLIKYVLIVCLIIIATSIFLSGSRTGIIAISFSIIIYLLRIKHVRRFVIFTNKLITISIVVLVFVLSSLFLFNQKKESAIGRLLIWTVSVKMIEDKPIFGHGFGSFEAKYMDFQAEYFKLHPHSNYSNLADNVKNPFNLILLITIEFGFIGLSLFLLLLLLLFKKTRQLTSEDRMLMFCGIGSFFIFAFLSYPLKYIANWLLILLYLSFLLPNREFKINYSSSFILLRLSVMLISTFFFIIVLKQCVYEIRWKQISQKSLAGETEKMIPEYIKLYPVLKSNPFFLYNYAAELNYIGRYNDSNIILLDCRKKINDYDIQILMADNYQKSGQNDVAISHLERASFMIPCRFWPLYKNFEIYKMTNRIDKAIECAKTIVNKEVKISSYTVTQIRADAAEFLKKQNQY